MAWRAKRARGVGAGVMVAPGLSGVGPGHVSHEDWYEIRPTYAARKEGRIFQLYLRDKRSGKSLQSRRIQSA